MHPDGPELDNGLVHGREPGEGHEWPDSGGQSRPKATNTLQAGKRPERAPHRPDGHDTRRHRGPHPRKRRDPVHGGRVEVHRNKGAACAGRGRTDADRGLRCAARTIRNGSVGPVPVNARLGGLVQPFNLKPSRLVLRERIGGDRVGVRSRTTSCRRISRPPRGTARMRRLAVRGRWVGGPSACLRAPRRSSAFRRLGRIHRADLPLERGLRPDRSRRIRRRSRAERAHTDAEGAERRQEDQCVSFVRRGHAANVPHSRPRRGINSPRAPSDHRTRALSAAAPLPRRPRS